MKNKLIYLAILIVVLLSLRSLFSPGFFQLHDFTHVARLVEMDRAIHDGHLPVRWSRDFAFGYGMPLFSFYGPLPSYVTELFFLIGFSAIDSLKLLLFVTMLAGAYGMYALSRRWFGRLGGLVATVVYSLMPYRALDLFVRGAFNELVALSIVPWILLMIVKLRERVSPGRVIGAAVCLGLLFITHNLMTMMFLPMLYVFALWMLIGVKKKKAYFIAVHLSLVLGVMLAAFFLFPSYLEKNFTQVESLIGGYSYYKYHFLYIRQLFTGEWGYGGSILGPHDDLSFSFGILTLATSAIGGVAWFMKRKVLEERLLVVFLTLATGLAFFMTIFKSSFIWDAVPLLAYFQFPWRFLSIPTILLPLLAGGVSFILPRRIRITVLSAFVVIFLVANLRFFQPASMLDSVEGLYYQDPQRIQSEMSGILPDYIPSTMKTIQKPFQPQFEIEGEQVEISTRIDRTHERLVSFKLLKPATLVVRIAWFPNWTAYDGSQKVPFTIDEQSGFMRIQLQPGEHLIAVRLEDTPLRMASNLVSLVGLLIVVGVLTYGRYRRD